jgi:hypothetical protein
LKLSIICILCLFAAVIATAAMGYAPTQARWGAEGVSSMIGIAVICLSSAIIAFVPIMIVAPNWPDQIGSAALAGTVLRLLLTVGGMLGYQVLFKPHFASFLFWSVIFYLLVLAIDTTFGAIAIKKYYRSTPPRSEGIAS